MPLNLELKNSQKLSPSTMQLMSILQMTSAELAVFVQRELQDNPMIDAELTRPSHSSNPFSSRRSALRSSADGDEGLDSVENLIPAQTGETLFDNIRSQLPGGKSPVKDCVLYAGHLLDDEGRLSEASCSLLTAKFGEETFSGALAVLQEMTPAGIGARSIEEMLILQLRRLPDDTSVAEGIAAGHLAELAKGHYQQIAKSLKLPLGDVYEACAQIKALSPHPCGEFIQPCTTGYFEPDVILDEAGALYLNDSALPDIRIDEYYTRLLSFGCNKDVSAYLREKLKQANWLISNIAQRRATIIKCTSAIVTLQSDFFSSGGRGALKPMTRAAVAEKVGVNPSTVSRALDGKYLQCAFGTFSFDSLFTSSIAAREDCVSSSCVKEIIKALISEESSAKPLSDQEISACLAKDGINISRRTVAKYRTSMGIPGTSSRRAAQYSVRQG